MQQEFVKSGSIVMEEGTLGQKAYIIKSGTVEVSVKGKGGEDILLAELGPGSLVGEMALMCGGLRRATVTAKEDLVLSSIPERDLLDVVGVSKKVYNYVAKLIILRSQEIQRKIQERKAPPTLLN